MSQYRPVGVFLVCLLAANFAALAVFFLPSLFDEIVRTSVGELIAGILFMSIFSLPITFMGGLTFGFGFLAIARSFSLSKSVATMAILGALAGTLYSLFVLMFLGGLRETFILVCLAGSAGGAVAGLIWTILHERFVND